RGARALALSALLALPLAACGGGSPSVAGGRAVSAPGPQHADTAGVDLIPPGYGTLRQDDIALKTQLPSTLVRMIPLDESVIRLLSSDSYRAMHELKEGRREAIAAMAARYNVRRPSLWYISFFALETESRFSPMEIVLQSAGRDFRPLDVIPLTTGFHDQRIKQRESQSAIYLFEDGVNLNQALTVSVEGVPNTTWESILRSIERERSVVRSRISK
ncbi:MAG: hypothetical protein M3081_08100, partial [Gemmatimonadota bacterium]|nr:hypothetical protein [Gemmatimonadota bacterium]